MLQTPVKSKKVQVFRQRNMKRYHLWDISGMARSAIKRGRMTNYDNIKNKLEKAIVGCDVHFFGSRVMGLSLKRSDLDIFIDMNQSYSDPNSKEESVKYITEVEAVLKRYPRTFVIENTIWDATVPIIKLTVIPRKMKCDLTFNSGMASKNSLMIRHLFEIQPAAYEMFHFVRFWALEVSRFQFTNYSLTLMVIFYLQHEHLMPTVVDVQKDLPIVKIGAWPVQMNIGRTLEDYGINKMEHYRKYLKGFFKFYGSFDFQNNVVFPFLGHLIPKNNYATNAKLVNFHDYIKDFKLEAPMCVASVNKFDHNCTAQITAKEVSRFVDYCSKMAKIIIE